jgi:ribosomal protein S18 acetylase RimI-like enzyme
MDYGLYELYWINIHPDHQNKGIGKKLVAHIIEAIKKEPEALEILLTANIGEGLPSYYTKYFGFKALLTFGTKYQLMTLTLD